jgi:hypothetical protein
MHAADDACQRVGSLDGGRLGEQRDPEWNRYGQGKTSHSDACLVVHGSSLQSSLSVTAFLS